MTTNAQKSLLTDAPVREMFALALAVLLVAFYAMPVAQTPAGEEGDDNRRLHEVAEHRPARRSRATGSGWSTRCRATNVAAAESKPVLHLLNLETNADVTVADATGGTFSPDSRWIAYQVDPGAAQRARAAARGREAALRRTSASPARRTTAAARVELSRPGGGRRARAGRGGAAPAIPPRRVELRNLATGEIQSWQEIGTFAFSAASTHLYLGEAVAGPRRLRAGADGGGTPGGSPRPGRPAAGRPPLRRGPRGLDVVLVDLRTGRHQLLGSVGDIAFNRTGRTAGLHRRHRREGRQRTVRLRHRERPHRPRSTTTRRATAGWPGTRTDRDRGAEGNRGREDAREGQRPARVPRRLRGAEGRRRAAARRSCSTRQRPRASPRAGS